MKKLLILVLVLGLASVAFAASDGFESYAAPISIDGLGSATGGWASSWVASHSTSPITDQYMAVSGGSPDDPDQHMQMIALDSGGYAVQRDLDTMSGSWTLSFDVKIVGTGDETGQRDDTEILLEDAAGQNGLQIKIGGTGFEMFRMNNTNMTVQYGDGAYPTMKLLHETNGDWVHLEVDYDATANTFQLYWEEQDGTLLAHAPAQAPDSSSWDGTISEVFIMGFKTYDGVDSGNGILIDGINIVPEPMTIALLGLGGLLLRRRKA